MNSKVNHGVNALWEVAYTDFVPYEDRLRSTNTKEFTRDTTLDKKVVVEVGLEPTIDTV